MKIDKSVFLEPFCFLERCQLSTHDTLLASGLAEKYFPNKPETKVPLAINLALHGVR
jgi:hypothetical protein